MQNLHRKDLHCWQNNLSLLKNLSLRLFIHKQPEKSVRELEMTILRNLLENGARKPWPVVQAAISSKEQLHPLPRSQALGGKYFHQQLGRYDEQYQRGQLSQEPSELHCG